MIAHLPTAFAVERSFGKYGLDDLALNSRIVGDRVEHRHRFRCLERQIEPGNSPGMRAERVAVRSEAAGSRRDASEHSAQIIRVNRAVEAKALGADTDPDAVGFASAGVVVVEALSDATEGVGLLPDPQFGDAQHGPQRAPTHSRPRSQHHSQSPESPCTPSR